MGTPASLTSTFLLYWRALREACVLPYIVYREYLRKHAWIGAPRCKTAPAMLQRSNCVRLGFSRPCLPLSSAPNANTRAHDFPIEHPHFLWEAYKQNPGARMFEPLGKYRIFFWFIKKVNRKCIKLDYTLATLFTLRCPWPSFWKRFLLERWMHFEFSPIPTAFPFPPDKVEGTLASRVVIVVLDRAWKSSVCLFFEPNCFRRVYSQYIWLFIIHHYPLDKHFESLRCICCNFTRFCCCKWVWRWILIGS